MLGGLGGLGYSPFGMMMPGLYGMMGLGRNAPPEPKSYSLNVNSGGQEAQYAYGGEVKCLAVAHGITKRAWALGETKEDAERNAIKTCYEGALETCTVPNQGSVCTEWQ
jgi:hypothetical protein